MWEKFIGKKCKIKVVTYKGHGTNSVYEGIVSAVDNEVIEINVEKVSADLDVKGTKFSGTTLIGKKHIVSITIVD